MSKSSRSASACRWLLTAVLLTPAAPVAAQVPSAPDSARGPAITAGAVVRVKAPSIAKVRIVGTVLTATPESLVVRGDSTWTIPVAAISRLELASGTRSNALKGLGWGALGGGLAGAGVGALACSGNNDLLGSKGCAVILGVYGAGAGAVVGLIVGAVTRSDVWVQAPTHPLRVAVDWRSGGLRLGATFTF